MKVLVEIAEKIFPISVLSERGVDGQSKWLTTDACWDAVTALGKKWTSHQEL